MPGVYGNVLAAFPELMKRYEVFKMRPRVGGGGYGERYGIREVEGYWSWRKQAKTGIEGDVNIPDHNATFWVKDSIFRPGTGLVKVVIEQNDFVEIDKEMFRVVGDQNFSHEGGFYKCLMQRVQGPTDRQVTNPRVADAIRGDY